MNRTGIRLIKAAKASIFSWETETNLTSFLSSRIQKKRARQAWPIFFFNLGELYVKLGSFRTVHYTGADTHSEQEEETTLVNLENKEG